MIDNSSTIKAIHEHVKTISGEMNEVKEAVVRVETRFNTELPHLATKQYVTEALGSHSESCKKSVIPKTYKVGTTNYKVIIALVSTIVALTMLIIALTHFLK